MLQLESLNNQSEGRLLPGVGAVSLPPPSLLHINNKVWFYFGPGAPAAIGL
jgi:hypothetical protein